VSPQPSQGRTGLIIATVIGLVLLLAGAGVGLWFLGSSGETEASTGSSSGSTDAAGSDTPDATPSTSDGATGSGAPERAARSLTAAFATLEKSHGTERFCDQAFAYGRGMVYFDQAECVDDWDGVFGHFTETERTEFSELTISSSALHAVDEDTLVVDWSEVNRTTPASAISDAFTDMGLGLVLQQTGSSDSWLIVGTVFKDEDELGTVPDTAREYLNSDGDKTV
jgi:hypothetical protein